MKRTVFYSWMSGRPPATNRSFIEKALEIAVDAITKDEKNELEVVVDQDARGEAGSTDISFSIFDKIDRCGALVADVSLIDPKGDAKEKTPNPNVLVELGYAAGKKGWGKVILVFNEAFGNLKTDPPFDLRNRNTLPYRAEEGEHDRSEERKKLAGRLEAALRAALLADEEAAKGAWLGKLAHPFFRLLIELDEFEENIEWDRRVAAARTWSEELRELSREPSAASLGVAEKVLELAERCDAFARECEWRHIEQAQALRAEMKGLAAPLKKQLFEDIELSASSADGASKGARALDERDGGAGWKGGDHYREPRPRRVQAHLLAPRRGGLVPSPLTTSPSLGSLKR